MNYYLNSQNPLFVITTIFGILEHMTLYEEGDFREAGSSD